MGRRPRGELAPRSVLNYWQVLAPGARLRRDRRRTRPGTRRSSCPIADVEEITPPTPSTSSRSSSSLAPRLRLPAVFLEQTAAGSRSCAPGSGRTSTSGLADPLARSEGPARNPARALASGAAVAARDLLETVPPDDRTPERRLFPGLNEGTMRDAIGRASRAAGSRSTRRTISGTAAARSGTRRDARPRTRRADGPHEGVDEPRRLHACDAAGRGRGGTTLLPLSRAKEVMARRRTGRPYELSWRSRRASRGSTPAPAPGVIQQVTLAGLGECARAADHDLGRFSLTWIAGYRLIVVTDFSLGLRAAPSYAGRS